MENSISNNVKSDLIKLGLYQICGGIVGILIIIFGVYKTQQLPGMILLIYLFILLFYAYSIFCGTLCLKIKKNALVHSLINQILQVIGFAMMGFAFKYVAGFYVMIGLDLTNSINFNFGAGVSKFDFNFNNEHDRLEVDFNLVSFALIYWIDVLRKRINEEIAIRQVSSIGET